MASTKEVLDHHLTCFREGDLKGLLSDYAPGTVMFMSDGPLSGADAIRPFFQALFAEFGKPGAAFSLRQQSVEGDYAYILWTAETADNVYELGTDTITIRDGKIVAQWDGLDVNSGTLEASDVFVQRHRLELPSDLPPGPYRISIGAYHPDSGERLQAQLDDRAVDSVVLGALTLVK